MWIVGTSISLGEAQTIGADKHFLVSTIRKHLMKIISQKKKYLSLLLALTSLHIINTIAGIGRRNWV